MPVTGGAQVMENLTKFGGGFEKRAKFVMQGAVDLLDIDVTKNMSLSDHTMKELADMDHPYAARHGSRGKPIHDPYWQIHTQGGLLLSSKKKGVEDAAVVNGQLKVVGWLGLDDTVAFYALYLIWGTSKMIPRDVLSGTLYNEDMKTKILNHIHSNFRDLVVNFRGVETK